MKSFDESLGLLLGKLETWYDSIIIHLPNILLALIVLIIGFLVSRWVKNWTKRLLHRTMSNKTMVQVLTNVFTIVFMAFVIFMVLSILELNQALTSLLAGAGIAGLALGLALQDPLVNMSSGILMSTREYYRVGDLVKTNDYEGIIEKINLRSTILKSPDGQEVILPNKDVIQNPLVNYSHTPRRRIDVSCGISYGDDLEKVREVVLQSIKDSFKLPVDKELEIFFYEFGDSSINFVVRFWQNVITQGEYLNAQDIAIRAIKKAFDKEGITIPFPIRTLDFGIVGGTRLDEVYQVRKSNGEDSTN